MKANNNLWNRLRLLPTTCDVRCGVADPQMNRSIFRRSRKNASSYMIDTCDHCALASEGLAMALLPNWMEEPLFLVGCCSFLISADDSF
jgi:hypothetical protein